MRTYEVAYIADPELDEQALETLEAKVVGWVEAAGGSVVKTDRWGRRRLAYPIRKRNEGVYVILFAQMPAKANAALERDLRLSEQVLRHMITLSEGA